MRSRAAVVGLILAAGAGSGSLFACGDKFLVASRGTRFERAAPPRDPASILVYADASSHLSQDLANVPIESTLRKAGYRPTVVNNVDELDRALRQGRWDLLLVDAGEIAGVSSRILPEVSPTVLPVVSSAAPAEWSQARTRYAVVLKSPAKRQSFLDSVDEALSARAKARAAAAARVAS